MPLRVMEAFPLSQRTRPFAVLVLTSLLSLSFLGAHAGGDGNPSVTYYLHGAGHVDAAAEFGAGADGPTMDGQAPTHPVPKVVRTFSGNQDFRKNFLLAYWGGEVHGRVDQMSARLWLAADAATSVTVSVFGDGGVGSAAPFARVSVPVAAGGPRPVDFDFGNATAMVADEMVLSVYAGAAGVTVLFDAASTPSALTFSLGPYESLPGVLPAWTPAPGWGPVTPVSFTHAHREASLAISPVDESLMFLCAPSGVPNTAEGQSFFHVSRDGGQTWSYLQVETDSADTRRYAFEGGDCDVAFDEAGTMYSADTWLGSLSVGSSRDGGATWYGTSLAASAPVVDRPWLVGGPAGVVHVTWQDVQFGMPSVIWYARSTDHGLTFTPAASVATASAEGAFTWTGNLVVAPGGQDLYSIYTRRQGPAVGSLEDTGAETVWVAASHDGGLTWSSTLIASMPNPASFLYPSLGMDAAGGLHAVFASRTTEDHPIWYAHSADGLAWSEPVKVLAGVAGYSPWVVGGAAGEAAIQWYGHPDATGASAAAHDWYFYWAKVTGAGTAAQAIAAGTTTTTPIFAGVSGIPEFNQVRTTSDGKMHVGAAAYFKNQAGGAGWALFHQREL